MAQMVSYAHSQQPCARGLTDTPHFRRRRQATVPNRSIAQALFVENIEGVAGASRSQPASLGAEIPCLKIAPCNSHSRLPGSNYKVKVRYVSVCSASQGLGADRGRALANELAPSWLKCLDLLH